MAQFKIGDKVRIRDDLIVGETYYMNDHSAQDSFEEEMKEYANKVNTIKGIRGGKYLLEDGSTWYWTDEMLLPVEKIIIEADGNTVTATLYRSNHTSEKAVAKCSPEDTFDFLTGAKIALERLGKKEINVCGFKVGDRINYHGFNGTIICIDLDDSIGIEFDEPNPFSYEHRCTAYKLKSGNHGEKEQCRWVEAGDTALKHGEAKLYNGKLLCIDPRGMLYTKGKIYEFKDGYTINDDGTRIPSFSISSAHEFMDASLADWIEVVE